MRCKGHTHDKNLLATFDVGELHGNLTVKAARAQDGFIENVHAVGAAQHHDAFGGVKAVHFYEQLVEGVFSAHGTSAPTNVCETPQAGEG